nr:glycosyltransferase family 4 protein [uncultured Carboxylicivirga sp.]
MFLLSHSGKQHSYHTAKSLFDLGLLDTYYTSSYITNHLLQIEIEKRNNTYWSRRFIKGLPGNKVNANWRFEMKEMALRTIQGKSPAVQEAVYARDINFDKYVSRQLIKKSKSNKELQFWGFQGSCYETLKAAKSENITSYCELATAHVTAAKRILGEEALLHKEWAHTIDNLVFPAYYEKRLEEEPHMASKAIAASTFTERTLLEAGIQKENIICLPLGFDLDYIPYSEKQQSDIEKRPLKLLYAGTVTQRKGIKYLLEALKEINSTDIELHIVGGIQGSDEVLNHYKGLFHYHPPVSQNELFQMYDQFDALVLPTIFEGFGLVIVEAMAAGLPVITTPHSIGPELITDSENGYIVPIRDIESLKSAIIQLRNSSEEQYLTMRIKARESATAYSWENYTKRMDSVLKINSQT